MLHLLFFPFYFFLLYRILRLLNNYVAARKLQLPIVLLPVSFEDAWWIPLRPLFKWVELLPFGLGDWYIYTTMGWPTEDGNRTSKRLGENFVLCSPSNNCIATCYPPAVQQIYGEHKNWPQPGAQSQLFAVYGQNVSSTNGAEWQRHRKITASAFNENTFREVWHETIRRVQSIDFEGEKERTLARIRTTFNVLAMQVLATTGFGQEDTELTSISPPHRESLMDSLGFLERHIMLTLLFSSVKAPHFLLPDVLRRLKVSVAEFRMYMEEAVLRHMQASKTAAGKHASSLLGSMIKANEAEKQQAQKSSGRPSYLTESELYGNIFVFNIAGYETTASSLTFALSFLAAYPDMQAWVVEEIDKYYTNHSNNDGYDAIYPKLVRSLSVMYETLRLASPAPLLVRSPREPTEIPVSTPQGPSTLTVMPGMLVGGNFYGGHLSSRWGPDSETFNPKRFVTSSPDAEALTVPEGPMYCPWIFGSRVCPGKKFSQVEFVALIAQLLSKWRVEILQRDGEDKEAARARLMRVLEGKYFNISTHLLRPEDAGVKFVRR